MKSLLPCPFGTELYLATLHISSLLPECREIPEINYLSLRGKINIASNKCCRQVSKGTHNSARVSGGVLGTANKYFFFSKFLKKISSNG